MLKGFIMSGKVMGIEIKHHLIQKKGADSFAHPVKINIVITEEYSEESYQWKALKWALGARGVPHRPPPNGFVEINIDEPGLGKMYHKIFRDGDGTKEFVSECLFYIIGDWNQIREDKW